MGKGYLIGAVAIAWATAAAAGPFGVDQGKPVSIYKGHPSTFKGAYHIDPPQPNSEFESYSAIATPTTGICKVWGIGRDHDNDRYGSGVKSAYDRLKALLDAKYGASKEISFLKSGALWKDDNEWVMAINQHERTVSAYWTTDKVGHMPDGIAAISLEIEATSSDSSYVDLTYEFDNFGKCKATLTMNDAAGL